MERGCQDDGLAGGISALVRGLQEEPQAIGKAREQLGRDLSGALGAGHEVSGGIGERGRTLSQNWGLVVIRRMLSTLYGKACVAKTPGWRC